MLGLFKSSKAASCLVPDASNLVPRIKNLKFRDAVKSLGASEQETPVTEELVGDLIVTYAFDLPHAFQMASPSACEKLGLKAAELRALAVDNFRRSLSRIDLEVATPLTFLGGGDGGEASLILLDELWDEIAADTTGTLVVAVPNRSVVAFATTDALQGLELLGAVVKEGYRLEPVHSLTRNFLTWRNRRWELFAHARNCAG